MVCTKNTARNHAIELPPARFPAVPTGLKERKKFYGTRLQLPIVAVAVEDRTELTPTLTGVASPEVERMVAQ